jgi:hypothetical protein
MYHGFWMFWGLQIMNAEGSKLEDLSNQKNNQPFELASLTH